MYDADEAAGHLGLKRATLSYWHRMLGSTSPATVCDDGTLLFSENAMYTFRWLKTVILDQHWPFARAREALDRGLPPVAVAAASAATSEEAAQLAAATAAMQAELHVLAEESKHMHRLLIHVIDLLTEGHRSPPVPPRPPQQFRIVRSVHTATEPWPRHENINGREMPARRTQPQPQLHKTSP